MSTHEIPDDIPAEALARLMANLGLVHDALQRADGVNVWRCASESGAAAVRSHQSCADPDCTLHHVETIKCPQCGLIQGACVRHTWPFWSYAHECRCGYWITESEWETVGTASQTADQGAAAVRSHQSCADPDCTRPATVYLGGLQYCAGHYMERARSGGMV